MYPVLLIAYWTYLSHFPGFILRGPPANAHPAGAVSYTEFVSRTTGPHR